MGGSEIVCVCVCVQLGGGGGGWRDSEIERGKQGVVILCVSVHVFVCVSVHVFVCVSVHVCVCVCSWGWGVEREWKREESKGW